MRETSSRFARALRLVTAFAPITYFSLGAMESCAHPHVFTTVRSQIEIDGSKHASSISHVWTFDEEYSAMAVQTLPAEASGKFTRQSLQPLADINIEELQKSNYFTYASSQSGKIEYGAAKDFYLEYRDGKILELHFKLPFTKPVDLANGGKLTFSIYDPTYFVDLGWDDTLPVSFAPAATPGCKVEIKDPEPPKEQTLAQAAEAAASEQPSDIGAFYAKRVVASCGGEAKS